MSQKFTSFIAKLNQEDLTAIGALMEAGKVTPVIDRRYSLSEAAEVVSYLEEGHARGKVIIDFERPAKRATGAPESARSQRGESPLQVNALRPVAECNCDAAMRGGEQQEVNCQSVG